MAAFLEAYLLGNRAACPEAFLASQVENQVVDEHMPLDEQPSPEHLKKTKHQSLSRIKTIIDSERLGVKPN